MKKILIAVSALLLNVNADAQLAVTTEAMNGQQSVRVTSAISGLTLGKKTIHVVKVSDDPSLIPTIQGSIDSFTATTTTVVKNDTMGLSIPYPGLYYISDSVTQYDTAGMVISKAGAVTTAGVCLTPIFLNPTLAISSPVSDSTSAALIATSTSGYDTGVLTIIVSYGDTSFSNPDNAFPALTKTIVPILGTTVQTHRDSLVVPIGENMPFSYKVVLTNSKKTVSSGIYKGRTHTKTTGVENLTTDTKPSGPGIVYVCSITGQRICSGHVRDVRNIREITSKVEISGTYVVYTTNDQGILMTSEVQHLMK